MIDFPGFKKGLNLGGWLSQSPLTKEHMDTFITEEDIKRIASMGADHVRLPVDYPLVETEDGTPKEEGYTYIDNCVAWCEKYGLHMLLDLHRAYGYSFGNAENCASFFEDPYQQKRFLNLWEVFAKRYGKYDFIAFDLLNEIVDPSVTDAWNDLAKRTVELIRKYAPTLSLAASTTAAVMPSIAMTHSCSPIRVQPGTRICRQNSAWHILFPQGNISKFPSVQ